MKLPSVYDNWNGYVPAPSGIELRGYQTEAIESVWDYFERTSTGNPLIVAPTGSGKSMILAGICHEAWKIKPGTRIMMLTHVQELIEQNEIALKRYWPDAPVGAFSAGMKRKEHNAPILFGGVQSVCRAVDKIGQADLVIVDECLTPGTIVSGRKVEDIRPGDMVDSFDHETGAVVSRRVLATRSCTSNRDLVSIESVDGRVVLSTDNHPVWVERTNGYIEAKCVRVGDLIRVLQVRSEVRSVEESDQDIEEGLPTVLLEELSVCGAELGAVSGDDGVKPHERSGGSAEDGGYAKGHRAQASAGREGSRADSSSEEAPRRAGRWLGSGAGYQDGEQEARGADVVFGGPCSRGEQDIGRSGRGEPRIKEGEGEGRATRYDSSLVRVAHVEVQEQGDHGGRVVHNLQIDQTENFFANGILTHNCHLIPKTGNGQYLSAFKSLRSIRPNLRVIGLTATPFRTDSGYLHQGGGALFDDLVYDIPLLDLMESGYICRVTSKATKNRINVDGVQRVGGDFVGNQLEQAAMSGDNVADAVTEVIKRGQNRRGWLFFASGKKHAEMILEEVKSRGISCAMVMGDTPKPERKQLIQDYKDRKIRAMVSVGVLTTGFDAPHVDLIALMRPTMSPGLHVQIVGRGLRICPGKKNCLVLDFAGNIERHGPLDSIRVREPGEGDGTAPVKECPMCQELVAAGKLDCPMCGYEFPPREVVKHEATPSYLSVISDDRGDDVVPEKPKLAVSGIKLRRHQKQGKEDSVCVSYQINMATNIREWLCFDHGKFMADKAKRIWGLLGGDMPAPESTDEALDRASEIVSPSYIRVKEGKWPEVTERIFMDREPGEDDGEGETVKMGDDDFDYGDIPF